MPPLHHNARRHDPAPCLVVLMMLLFTMAVPHRLLADAPAGDKTTPDSSCLQNNPSEWRWLEPGLELGCYNAPGAEGSRKPDIHILRIDPDHFDFVLLNSSAPGQGKRFTAKEWCRKENLVAATNTSMYQEDCRTSVSYMRSPVHTNNSYISKDKAILAFDRRDSALPKVCIIDRDCDDFHYMKELYGTLIQSIRMISCQGNNVWEKQQKKWSAAIIGIDKNGRVLFIHVRKPFPMHDLINILMELPLDLKNAMYVEGGPESQLFVQAGDIECEFMGSYETGFLESDANFSAWPIPNVVGIRRIGGDENR
ncbi:MAG: phosphodiester glycosidase family protein [Candidatus Eisenbacteria bacterium]|uniref:Phosphodiester glycosidase family protein n=1 Tax=Eiseniibacteriota bacterium TaxID=2212470 RepID=A0A948S1U8_UNCEI|nr:phosphodiester glycosidase family protein [Candidatus Eisenbacteria bacterium]MBU1948184.1 phosphodiester glycosidase family protein [Candidatus Eisenbacteria bacterium]MBU2692299.1 phosphodiester glycosidase family protein [Candidatus Eisenbacteria bacterium]